jgi:hypothetical protein
MWEDVKLRYTQPLWPNLTISLMVALSMAIGPIWRGRWAAASIPFGFFLAMGLATRHLLKNQVSRQGFGRGGAAFYDWADVRRARMNGAHLELECHNAGNTKIPANIISDPAFLSAIQEWLPEQHPVRIALESTVPDGAERNA